MPAPKRKREGPARNLELNPRPRFFERQLSGEETLTYETAEKLFALAEEAYVQRPWERLADTELVLVKQPGSGEMCYCSVMGALGQAYAINAYLGPESYRLFKRISGGEPVTTGEFFASQNSVSVEFLPSGKLTPPDKALARAFGHPLTRGLAAPQFRAIRRRYHPWYVTESEARVLALCIDSVLAFCEHQEEIRGKRYWMHEDVYPEVVWYKQSRFKVNDVLVPDVACPEPVPGELDGQSLTGLKKQDYPIRGTVEMDHFYTGAPLGKKEERKACLRAGLVIDAETMFLYSAEVAGPSESEAQIVSRVLIKAIECAKFVPARVLVRDESLRVLLSALEARLGFEVKVQKRLPALETAKQDLLRRLGDPGIIEP
jgi:hypothetical protein